MIKISQVKVTPVKPADGLIAFCSYVINDSFYIGDVGLHYSPERERDPYWLVYPVKTLFNGKQINVCHPINRETELLIKRVVVARYEERRKKGMSENKSIREETWSHEKESSHRQR